MLYKNSIHTKKKSVIRIIIILLSLTLFASCTKERNLINDKDKLIIEQSPYINTDLIVQQIKRSSTPDYGYRFANAEFLNQISPFATYYIRESKILSGLISNNDSIEMISVLLKNLEDNQDSLNLTDIFCTLMLSNDISNLAKKNISTYLDSLYDERHGFYSLIDTNKIDMIDNIYTTFLVKKISNLLNIETKDVDNWLSDVSKELLKSNNITAKNSSSFVMLLELFQLYDIDISKDLFNSVLEMFEKDLEDISNLEKNDSIYFPVYLMDYLDLNLLLNNSTSKYNDKIINSLCDENGIKDYLIQEYDSFGLYATIRTLYLSGYDFKNSLNVNKTFDNFDSFLLDQTSYINPGYVESNFYDTYFVDSITHILPIDPIGDIGIYCEQKKNQILQSNLIEINYFLKLLQRNDLLYIVNDKKQELITLLFSSLESIFDSNTISTEKLPYINAIISSLEILGEDWFVEEIHIDNFINNYKENSDLQLNTINIIELVTFINSINKNRTEIKQLCENIVENIVQINNLDLSNKLLIQSKALSVLIDCDYIIPDKLIDSIKNTLNNSNHVSGLFKGGDNHEDVISFRSTYDAIFLSEIINMK